MSFQLGGDMLEDREEYGWGLTVQKDMEVVEMKKKKKEEAFVKNKTERKGMTRYGSVRKNISQENIKRNSTKRYGSVSLALFLFYTVLPFLLALYLTSP